MSRQRCTRSAHYTSKIRLFFIIANLVYSLDIYSTRHTPGARFRFRYQRGHIIVSVSFIFNAVLWALQGLNLRPSSYELAAAYHLS